MSLYANDSSSSSSSDGEGAASPHAEPTHQKTPSTMALSGDAGSRPASAAQRRARAAAAEQKRKQRPSMSVAATEKVPAATQPRVIQVSQASEDQRVEAVTKEEPQSEPKEPAAVVTSTPKRRVGAAAAARRKAVASPMSGSEAPLVDSEAMTPPPKRVLPPGEREDVLGSDTDSDADERERRARALAAAKKKKLQQQRLAQQKREAAAAAAAEAGVSAEAAEGAAEDAEGAAPRKGKRLSQVPLTAGVGVEDEEAPAEKPKAVRKAAAGAKRTSAAALKKAAAEKKEAEGEEAPDAPVVEIKEKGKAVAEEKEKESEGDSSDARPVSPEKKKGSASDELNKLGMASSFDPTAEGTSAGPGPTATTSFSGRVADPLGDGALTMIPPKEMISFVNKPGPRGSFVQCKIQRMCKGMDRIYPTYFVYLEETNQFLLAARRRKRSTSSNYLISMNQADLARKSDAYVGKVRSNFMGSEFLVFDNGENPKKTEDKSKSRKELASIFYGTNMLGLSGPRKMQILIPARADSGECLENQPGISDKSIADRFKSGNKQNIVGLHNKSPVWDEDSQTYTLNFHSRVKLPSVKNFQVVHPDNVDDVLMQFGRVTEFVFSMDYKYPLSLLQAFGIALTSFDNKIACE